MSSWLQRPCVFGGGGLLSKGFFLFKINLCLGGLILFNSLFFFFFVWGGGGGGGGGLIIWYVIGIRIVRRIAHNAIYHLFGHARIRDIPN